MFRGKNILAIGAHPDDIEFGCFGTLLKFPSKVLVCYVMSWGGLGDPSSGEGRMKEAKDSLKLLSPKEVVVEPTNGVNPMIYHRYVDKIEALVRTYHINLVLAPTRYDTHQDHRLVHDIAVTALRENESDLLFYDPHCRTLDFRPNLFVRISKEMDRKIAALTNHKTQNEKYYMKEGFIRSYHKKYVGLTVGGYCEAFEVGRIWIYS